ncbi:MAG: hypothetical protein LBU58_06995, partial [Clostridiales bacterium]|nr:hypothetical protein [Clostridiales bacterium]
MKRFAAFFARALRNPCFAVGLVLVAALLALVVTGLFYTPYPPNRIDRNALAQPPGAAHWFGADNLGRDILSRVMYAGRTAFATGFLSAGISLVIGTLLGLFAGAGAGMGGREDGGVHASADTGGTAKPFFGGPAGFR